MAQDAGQSLRHAPSSLSQLTTAFIAAHAQDYAAAYRPAYAPELNPEE
jgi:hypothetical protein